MSKLKCRLLLYCIFQSRLYYVLCATALLIFLILPITGPDTIYPINNAGWQEGKYAKPGIFSIVMMWKNGNWNTLFMYKEKDKDVEWNQRKLSNYKDNVQEFYTFSESGWSYKTGGKIYAMASIFIFLLVLLSPFIYHYYYSWFLLGSWGGSLILYMYYLFLEYKDEIKSNPVTLFPGEYYMIIPCILTFLSVLIFMCFYSPKRDWAGIVKREVIAWLRKCHKIIFIIAFVNIFLLIFIFWGIYVLNKLSCGAFFYKNQIYCLSAFVVGLFLLLVHIVLLHPETAWCFLFGKLTEVKKFIVEHLD